jgi:hypothetical protein
LMRFALRPDQAELATLRLLLGAKP